MSTLQSYWVQVYTTGLLTTCLGCSHWMYAYTSELLTARLRCRRLHVYIVDLMTAYLHCIFTDSMPTCFQVRFSFHVSYQSVKIFCVFSLWWSWVLDVLLQNTVFKTYCTREVANSNNNLTDHTYSKGASGYKTCFFALCNVVKWKYAVWEVTY
jgi:hypothetical protein